MARLEKEFSQDYVGMLLETSQISYHNLENGKTKLKLETLLRLSDIFEKDIKYFFEFDEIDKKAS